MSPEVSPVSNIMSDRECNVIRSPNQLRLFDIKSLADLVYEEKSHACSKITVVVPLYNYEQYILECLHSIMCQDISALSLLVVDDCSTDHGCDLVVEMLQGCPSRFAMARVIKHKRNQGLAMSRNSGIIWSDEPFLFMLDADNRIRPPALSRLLEALLSANADFAYSQLFLFGTQDGIGNADIWDPERFSLVGNYIDGMALVSRQALMAVGGYRGSAVQEGWEDFDLWCRFAELGYRGVFLPEPLCEYRVHESSMLHKRTDRHQRSLALEMALRFPTILSREGVPPFVEICSTDTTS
jgi:glycosyltransferase involved in cell wall biosynthesis